MTTTCFDCLVTFVSLDDYDRHRPRCPPTYKGIAIELNYRIGALEAENAALKARLESAEGALQTVCDFANELEFLRATAVRLHNRARAHFARHADQPKEQP